MSLYRNSKKSQLRTCKLWWPRDKSREQRRRISIYRKKEGFGEGLVHWRKRRVGRGGSLSLAAGKHSSLFRRDQEIYLLLFFLPPGLCRLREWSCMSAFPSWLLDSIFFFFLSKCGSQAHDPKIKSPPSTKLSQVPLPTPTTNSILSKISFIHFHNSNILFFELGGIYTNICFIITHYPGIYVLFFCLYIAQQIFFPKKS